MNSLAIGNYIVLHIVLAYRKFNTNLRNECHIGGSFWSLCQLCSSYYLPLNSFPSSGYGYHLCRYQRRKTLDRTVLYMYIKLSHVYSILSPYKLQQHHQSITTLISIFYDPKYGQYSSLKRKDIIIAIFKHFTTQATQSEAETD